MIIIHCDDSQEILEVVRSILIDRIPAARVESFQNPIEAIQRAKLDSPDLFITDGQMFELQGPQVIKQLRNNGFKGFIAMYSGDVGNTPEGANYRAYKGDGQTAIDEILKRVSLCEI